MKCPHCGAKMRDQTVRCDRCRSITLPSHSRASSVLKPLADIEDEELRRHSVGIWDPVFGGGIPETFTVLLGGDPGTGKTTLCLGVCALLATSTGRPSVYLSCEQSDREVKARAVQIGLHNRRDILFLSALGGLEVSVADLLKPVKPSLLIVDSLSSLFTDHDFEGMGSFCKQAKSGIAVPFKCPVILILHATKSDHFAGPLALQHDVDITLTFEKLDDETRILQTEKNRAGPSGVRIRVGLGKDGFDWLETFVPGQEKREIMDDPIKT